MVKANRDSTLIQNTSGTLVNVNQSGQLAVEAIVSVGATTVNISGETLHLAALDVSGTFPNLYVTQSGKSVSGIPHKLVVAFSGEIVVAKVSGEIVVTSVSGNVVNTKISGETVRLVSGHNDVSLWAFDPSGLRYNQLWVENSGGHKLQAEIAAGALSVQVSGNILYLASGFNAVSLVSGVNIVKTSGESVVVTSGQVQVLSGAVSISGSAVNVTSGQVQVTSGSIVGKISGETIRVGASGFSYTDNRGFDYDALVNRNVAVTESGEVRIAGSISAATDVSGQIVYAVMHTSGSPLTPLASMVTTSGAALLTVVAAKTAFKAYVTLPVTALSGGTQLLSGNSTVVSVRNISTVTGCVMYVGSSGTGNAPFVMAAASGLGWLLNRFDAVTIPIYNPNLLRVVTLAATSGSPVSYMISADV